MLVAALSFSAFFALCHLAALSQGQTCTAQFTYFPPNATRECDGSGGLWFPVDTGIPTAVCDCGSGPFNATIITANMNPALSTATTIRKPEIVNLDPNGCGNSDWGGGSFGRNWIVDCGSVERVLVRLQTIFIVDTVAPNITLSEPEIVSRECIFPPSTSQRTPPTCTDNCDKDVDYIYNSYSLVPMCPGQTVVVRNWTCSDGCKNSAFLAQREQYVDTTPPVITMNFADPAFSMNPALNGGNPTCCTTYTEPGCSTGIPTASDTCDYEIASMDPVRTDTEVIDSCGQRTINRNWSIVDCSSNAAWKLQKIIVDVLQAVNSLNSELQGLNGAVGAKMDPEIEARLFDQLDMVMSQTPISAL